VAYFRTYFNRHFKEPISCVSDSMTEDAAVFGGQKNMFDGLENAKAIYKPDMIAVSTTCMAEVIGDDLNAFINNTKKEGHIPTGLPGALRPYAVLRRFAHHRLGQHVRRHPALLHAEQHGRQEGRQNGKINIVPGFETYLGNYRVIKRMLKPRWMSITRCSPTRAKCSTPRPTANSACTPAARRWTKSRTRRTPSPPSCCSRPAGKDQEVRRKHLEPRSAQAQHPDGCRVDRRVPDEGLRTHRQADPRASLELERGRCMDMMTDSHAWLHGKKFALYGDPDFVMGMVKILLECGAEPTHILCNNGNKRGKKAMESCCSSPFGVNGKVYVGNDLWHLRSLCFTDKPDFLIGNSYGKFIQRDTLHKGEGVRSAADPPRLPDLRPSPPAPQTTLGYEGMMSVLTTADQRGAGATRRGNHRHGHHRLQLRPGR
jgi:nitrogenase molybdenum-iron protein beta chain